RGRGRGRPARRGDAGRPRRPPPQGPRPARAGVPGVPSGPAAGVPAAAVPRRDPQQPARPPHLVHRPGGRARRPGPPRRPAPPGDPHRLRRCRQDPPGRRGRRRTGPHPSRRRLVGRARPAGRLSGDRRVRAGPTFAVTTAPAPVVAEICTRLDGIPLAIELAAARIRVLTAQQILDGLEDRFRLLTGGTRGGLRRQQTLEASVAWSHDLLTPDERVLFRRLSVFAGGFTLDAAETVGAGSGPGCQPAAVLDLLDGLAAK